MRQFAGAEQRGGDDALEQAGLLRIARQAVLAGYLNTSPSTVQKWETGAKSPSGPSLKLLHLVRDKGLDALI